MKHILQILLGVAMCVCIYGCTGLTKPDPRDTVTKPLDPLPSQMEQKIQKVETAITTVKAAPIVRDVKHELVTTDKYDDFMLVEPAVIVELDTSIHEAKEVAIQLRDTREAKIEKLVQELADRDDAEFKRERSLLHFILYLSIIAVFAGVICAYFNKHLIQISLIGAGTGLLALGVLKSLSMLVLLSVCAVTAAVMVGLYVVIKKYDLRKLIKQSATEPK